MAKKINLANRQNMYKVIVEKGVLLPEHASKQTLHDLTCAKSNMEKVLIEHTKSGFIENYVVMNEESMFSLYFKYIDIFFCFLSSYLYAHLATFGA